MDLTCNDDTMPIRDSSMATEEIKEITTLI